MQLLLAVASNHIDMLIKTFVWSAKCLISANGEKRIYLHTFRNKINIFGCFHTLWPQRVEHHQQNRLQRIYALNDLVQTHLVYYAIMEIKMGTWCAKCIFHSFIFLPFSYCWLTLTQSSITYAYIAINDKRSTIKLICSCRKKIWQCSWNLST